MVCLLVFRIVHHVLDKASWPLYYTRGVWRLGHVFNGKLYLTRDLVYDAFIPSHIAVRKAAPKPAPKLAPKPSATGNAQGKKKKHVQQFTMCYSLTKKRFISEPVDP